MTTATELKTQLLTKAAEDGDFRACLLVDPKATISAELDTTIPEGFKSWCMRTAPPRRTWCCHPRRR